MTHGGGQFMTLPEAWTFLGISRSGLYRLFAQGELVKVRVGGRAHVLRASVLALMGRAVEDATPPGGLPLGGLVWPPGTVGALEHGEGSLVASQDQPDPEGPG